MSKAKAVARGLALAGFAGLFIWLWHRLLIKAKFETIPNSTIS